METNGLRWKLRFLPKRGSHHGFNANRCLPTMLVNHQLHSVDRPLWKPALRIVSFDDWVESVE